MKKIIVALLLVFSVCGMAAADTSFNPSSVNIKVGELARVYLMSTTPQNSGYSVKFIGIDENGNEKLTGTLIGQFYHEQGGYYWVKGMGVGNGIMRAMFYDPYGNFTGEYADLHVTVVGSDGGGGGGCSTAPGVFLAVVSLPCFLLNIKKQSKERQKKVH